MSGTLEHLVKNEGSPGEKKRTATEGLMWLLRGLQFTLAALRRSLDNPDEELSVSFTKAYEATLSKHHSFVVRPVFSVAMKACPYRKDFYAKLGEPADKVVVQLKAWLDALEKILDRMEYLYVYVTLKHGIADAHTDRRTTPRASSSIAPPAPSMLYLPHTPPLRHGHLSLHGVGLVSICAVGQIGCQRARCTRVITASARWSGRRPEQGAGRLPEPSSQPHCLSIDDMGVLDITPAGVVSGHDVYKVFDYAREHHFAIPAFNVTVCSVRAGVGHVG